MTDSALRQAARETLRELLACCEAWEPTACVMGNVRAGDAADALRAALAEQEPTQEQVLDRGPWAARKSQWGVRIESDDFEHDVSLHLSGDFASDEDWNEYAQAIVDRLNERPITGRASKERP
jgi:hypothetical protein